VTSSGSRKTVEGQVGSGGPHLELTTGHGDLQLRRGGPVAPAVPKPPVPPVPPAGAKHLKPPKDAATAQPTEQ
jgi:hypothetical protein